jgi:hypothetical protein
MTDEQIAETIGENFEHPHAYHTNPAAALRVLAWMGHEYNLSPNGENSWMLYKDNSFHTFVESTAPLAICAALEWLVKQKPTGGAK